MIFIQRRAIGNVHIVFIHADENKSYLNFTFVSRKAELVVDKSDVYF